MTGGDRRLTASVGGADGAQQHARGTQPGDGDELPDAVLAHGGAGRTATRDEHRLRGAATVDAGPGDVRERLGDVGPRVSGHTGWVPLVTGQHEIVRPQRTAVLLVGVP